MLRLPTTGSALNQFWLNDKAQIGEASALSIVGDSSALVRRRHLARADVKGSYAAMRLIGLCRYFKSCIVGFALRPRFSPLRFSAQPEKTAFKPLAYATFMKLPGRTRKSSVLLHLPPDCWNILRMLFPSRTPVAALLGLSPLSPGRRNVYWLLRVLLV